MASFDQDHIHNGNSTLPTDENSSTAKVDACHFALSEVLRVLGYPQESLTVALEAISNGLIAWETSKLLHVQRTRFRE
jgi:hypothetical protein